MAGKWRAYLPGQDLIPGKWVAGPRGLGVLAQNVPAIGTSGGALLRQGPSPTITLPADNDVEVRAQIITPPPSGVLFVDNDSSATYGNPAPGVYSATLKYWRAGVDMGNFTATFIIGSVASMAGAINALAFSGSVGSDTPPPRTTSLDGVLNALTFSGIIGAPLEAQLSGSLDGAIMFSGAAGSGPSAQFQGSLAGALSFSGAVGQPDGMPAVFSVARQYKVNPDIHLDNYAIQVGNALSWEKDPQATLDYSIDWSDWIADVPGDALFSMANIATAGVQVLAQAVRGAVTGVMVTGGATVGAWEQVTIRITTLLGRIDERTIKLLIRDR